MRHHADDLCKGLVITMIMIIMISTFRFQALGACVLKNEVITRNILNKIDVVDVKLAHAMEIYSPNWRVRGA